MRKEMDMDGIAKGGSVLNPVALSIRVLNALFEEAQPDRRTRLMQRELTLRFLAEPSEVNFGGKGARRHRDEVDRPGRLRPCRRLVRALLRDRLRAESASSPPSISEIWSR